MYVLKHENSNINSNTLRWRGWRDTVLRMHVCCSVLIRLWQAVVKTSQLAGVLGSFSQQRKFPLLKRVTPHAGHSSTHSGVASVVEKPETASWGTDFVFPLLYTALLYMCRTEVMLMVQPTHTWSSQQRGLYPQHSCLQSDVLTSVQTGLQAAHSNPTQIQTAIKSSWYLQTPHAGHGSSSSFRLHAVRGWGGEFTGSPTGWMKKVSVFCFSECVEEEFDTVVCRAVPSRADGRFKWEIPGVTSCCSGVCVCV